MTYTRLPFFPAAVSSDCGSGRDLSFQMRVSYDLPSVEPPSAAAVGSCTTRARLPSVAEASSFPLFMSSRILRDSTEGPWTKASRKRRVLALYLDFLIVGGPWTLAVWGLHEAVPGIQRLHYPIQLFLLLVLETVLLHRFSWSPGHWLLGIRRLSTDPFALPGAPERLRPAYVVEPWLKRNERWWTILFGVVAVLDGVKSLVRWTMWTPAIPFMGVQLTDGVSVAVLLVLGTLECAVGCAVLRLRPVVVALGPVYYGVILTSVILSWPLWPAWAERFLVARRAYQGLPVREGEVEFIQRFVPLIGLGFGLLMTICLLVVAVWILRARRIQRQHLPQVGSRLAGIGP